MAESYRDIIQNFFWEEGDFHYTQHMYWFTVLAGYSLGSVLVLLQTWHYNVPISSKKISGKKFHILRTGSPLILLSVPECH